MTVSTVAARSPGPSSGWVPPPIFRGRGRTTFTLRTDILGSRLVSGIWNNGQSISTRIHLSKNDKQEQPHTRHKYLTNSLTSSCEETMNMKWDDMTNYHLQISACNFSFTSEIKSKYETVATHQQQQQQQSAVRTLYRQNRPFTDGLVWTRASQV